MRSQGAEQERQLSPYFTKLGVWAFSIGTSIGWGSFIVTCNTYLSQAGPLGSVLGLLLGMMMILPINHNLCYMMERCPDAGGIYTYGTRILGHDSGFVVAWFLLLTYLAVFWANITSLPLFARRFLGSVFRFGYCYTILGYDVYLGEVLLCVAAVLVFALLCSASRTIPHYLMIAMALFFVCGLSVCALVAFVLHRGYGFSYDPAFVPDRSVVAQVIRIAVMSPWAFIGFENASHFSMEFRFPVRKVRGAMFASVIVTTGVYLVMTGLSVTAFPPEYATWLEYIGDMDNLEGIRAIPAFYAASYYLGDAGVSVMLLALLCVVLTSMIGNLTALSRLLYALGRDRVASERLGTLNRRQIPGTAIWAAAVISCVIPFFGRTAISWIVDVTTLGATIIYGFLSYAVWRDAKNRGDRRELLTGVSGTLLMVGFAVLLLAPKLLSTETMAPESYLLFAFWSVLGLLNFQFVLKKDTSGTYGRSIVVWISLLLVMLFTCLMWASREAHVTTMRSMEVIEAYYSDAMSSGSYSGEDAEAFLSEQARRLDNVNSHNTLISFTLFMLAVGIMIHNYHTSRRKEIEWENELKIAKQIGLTDSLTKVKNKLAYTQWEKQIDAQIQSGSCPPFAVVVCDINGLKYTNDHFGHLAGDECIRRVSSRICKVFAHSPVFRYGGDEFVVLLRDGDYENRAELIDIINKESDARAGSRFPQDVIALGMAEYEEGVHNSLLRVFELADYRMYERKRQLKQAKNAR